MEEELCLGASLEASFMALHSLLRIEPLPFHGHPYCLTNVAFLGSLVYIDVAVYVTMSRAYCMETESASVFKVSRQKEILGFVHLCSILLTVQDLEDRRSTLVAVRWRCGCVLFKVSRIRRSVFPTCSRSFHATKSRASLCPRRIGRGHMKTI